MNKGGIEMAYKKKAELEQELVEALQRIVELEEELEAVKNCVHKYKNERNAGRKSKFGNEEKGKITMLFLQGKSYRVIAKEMNCSVGLVHKILNEHKHNNKECK